MNIINSHYNGTATIRTTTEPNPAIRGWPCVKRRKLSLVNKISNVARFWGRFIQHQHFSAAAAEIREKNVG